MELKREVWTNSDILPFQEYLKSFSKGEEKAMWEARIVNTKLPCLAVPSDVVKDIVRQISKGNFLSFVELWIWETHTNTQILAELITKIDDFELQKKYLMKLGESADSWATTDAVKIKVNNNNKLKYFEFAKSILYNEKPFVRRLGLILLLKLSNQEDLVDEILNLANTFYNEEHYYVNMANAWLVCEMMTKHREKTLKFLKSHNLNNFTINKAISKCRDSFRISDEDKNELLKFKTKNT